MIGARILITDDEPAIRRLLKGTLERAGYRISEGANAREALSLTDIDKPDLVLLDLGLPDRDGLELVPLLRARGAAVLIVSARDATAEKVAALDLGAEDYVTKPFDTEEVLARVRTALRRAGGGNQPQLITAGNVTIDLHRRLVLKEGEEVHLRPKEYALLAELAREPDKVITHSHLLRTIWGPAHEKDLEYLRVAARGLRLKLEDDPATPRMIINEPAVGYRLRLTQGPSAT